MKVIYDAVLGVRIFGCPISGVRLLWRDLLPHNYTDNTVHGGKWQHYCNRIAMVGIGGEERSNDLAPTDVTVHMLVRCSTGCIDGEIGDL